MHKFSRTTAYTLMFGLLTVPAFAQERPTVEQVQQQLAAGDAANAAGVPADAQQPVGDAQAIPPRLTIRAGTYVTVRLNEFLSSDRSQAGDAFTATLTKPIVVDGIVVASRGQYVTGRVTEAKKAGRVSGTSRLGIQLVELPVVDGQQLPIQSELLNRNGSTSVGRDVGAVAATTGVGAAIGAGVNGGVGAGVGAGAGLIVGLAGVLLTRGHPTIVYPETMLTFRVNQDVTVSTERSVQAFRFVQPADYQGAPALARRPMPPGPPYAAGYAPYGGYPYPYPYYGGYPYWGPGFGFYFGPGFYGRRWR
ncbi:MAG TPA: hypothetical protein VK752_21585 [Bryobacteraceae bacterium]|jgi:hypothetical protein|nr:hypothetical protein [Bryobacteraceae bacterium]